MIQDDDVDWILIGEKRRDYVGHFDCVDSDERDMHGSRSNLGGGIVDLIALIRMRSVFVRSKMI